MLTYEYLKTRPKEFLSATGLTVEESEQLRPAFAAAYRAKYSSEQTVAGLPRKRKAGGGPKGKLPQMEDKLLFILVYQKTYPLQTRQALHFEMSQPQANAWIHRLLPVLQAALATLGMQPARTAAAWAASESEPAQAADWLLDGSERQRQRPKDKHKQQEHDSGKKKAHTDKNLLLVHGQSQRVLYLSQTVPGKSHDKKLADSLAIRYAPGTTLAKDTGFQGYEPSGAVTFQPKKA